MLFSVPPVKSKTVILLNLYTTDPILKRVSYKSYLFLSYLNLSS